MAMLHAWLSGLKLANHGIRSHSWCAAYALHNCEIQKMYSVNRGSDAGWCLADIKSSDSIQDCAYCLVSDLHRKKSSVNLLGFRPSQKKVLSKFISYGLERRLNMNQWIASDIRRQWLHQEKMSASRYFERIWTLGATSLCLPWRSPRVLNAVAPCNCGDESWPHWSKWSKIAQVIPGRWQKVDVANNGI